MANKKKKIEKFDKLLQSYVDNKTVVNIERTIREGEANISGIVVAISKKFLLIKEVYDFEFRGYVIIRMDEFESIGYREVDRTIRKILKKEGILNKKYELNTKIDIKRWDTIFNDLMKNDIHVIVECENIKNPNFTIGPIEKVSKSKVQIRFYDVTGKLDKKLTKIDYEKITLVRFKDPYSTIFRKYLKKA